MDLLIELEETVATLECIDGGALEYVVVSSTKTLGKVVVTITVPITEELYAEPKVFIADILQIASAVDVYYFNKDMSERIL